MPEAYRNKQVCFMGNILFIDERVFIPNPETELLVKAALEFLDLESSPSGVILDVGTGSGAIGIAIACQLPDVLVYAIDISPLALEVAAVNIQKAKCANVVLRCCDLVADIAEEPVLIVANLPWGKEAYMLKSNTAQGLACMPEIAIYPQNGIIGAYLKLCRQVEDKGWRTSIYAEVGRIPQGDIQQLMPERYNWQYLQVDADYAILVINF